MNGRTKALLVAILFISAIQLSAQDPAQKPPEPEGKQEAQKPQVNWLYGAYVPKEVPLRPLNANERLKLYVAQSFITPGIYVKTFFVAGVDQATNSPSAWGGGVEGYAKRAGSQHAQSLIQNSMSSIGNGLLGYEPRYDRCKCEGAKRRISHAVMRNFLTYNRTERELRPNIMLYGAAAATGVIAGTWLPDDKSNWNRASRNLVIQAGFGSLSNLVAEFAPEIKRLITRDKKAPPPEK